MRLSSYLWICLIAMVLCGCAGYRVGPVNGETAGSKSVQVIPFSNSTLEPRLTDAVTTAVRRRLQQDGTYHLSSRDDSDIILTGVITRYVRTELLLNPEDTLTVQDFRVTITADVTARTRTTGDVIFTQTVTGFTMVEVGSDLTSSERQALPLLAESLAKNVVSLLAEGKWW